MTKVDVPRLGSGIALAAASADALIRWLGMMLFGKGDRTPFCSVSGSKMPPLVALKLPSSCRLVGTVTVVSPAPAWRRRSAS